MGPGIWDSLDLCCREPGRGHAHPPPPSCSPDLWVKQKQLLGAACPPCPQPRALPGLPSSRPYLPLDPKPGPAPWRVGSRVAPSCCLGQRGTSLSCYTSLTETVLGPVDSGQAGSRAGVSGTHCGAGASANRVSGPSPSPNPGPRSEALRCMLPTEPRVSPPLGCRRTWLRVHVCEGSVSKPSSVRGVCGLGPRPGLSASFPWGCGRLAALPPHLPPSISMSWGVWNLVFVILISLSQLLY